MGGAEALYLGQTLNDRYRIKEYLAEGGFCKVFIADDLDAGTEVALKILAPSVSMAGQLEFDIERRLLEILKKASNVVNVLDAGSDLIMVQAVKTGAQVPLQVHYLSLELAAGCLTDLLPNRHQVSWLEKIKLYRGVVKGAHQMHLSRIVHRDIKSENALLFLRPRQSTEAKVADLGRSRNLREKARFSAIEYLDGRGDLRFAPPELLWLQGYDDALLWARADLYLLGSVLFEVATGLGISSLAFGDCFEVLRRAIAIPEAARRREFLSRLSDMRSQMELAYAIFSPEVPSSIRHPATEILRGLTDPDPVRRGPLGYRAESASPAWDLEWLLRKLDILSRMLFNSESKVAHRRRKGGNRDARVD